MSESMIETVKIVSEKSDDNPQGFIVINAEDFDASIHTHFGDEVEVSEEVKEGAKRGRKPKAIEE
jgi:hypothetical protein